ncbi:MAG: citrate:proton symporter [Caulobacteraceae bacterium]|nr:citrate:proton symporter [Caulobacteraceae bacterium]
MVDAVEGPVSAAVAGDAGLVALPRRVIVAATIGNALEFYDFITYGLFAIQIGHAFFPTHSAYGSLMLSLATFGAGFITRPIGAVVIGTYADRVGRRAAMMLSLTMMGAAIIVLALIPPYAKIGIAAPILAVLARMAQGFSLGGEVGPTTAYLLEAAPVNRRGLAVAWQGASQGIAASLGALVGVGLSSVLAPAALDAYGWRIAFLLGAVALPFGLWIRRGLPETLHAPDPTAAPPSAHTTFGLIRENARIIILALAVLSSGTIGTYVFSYMVTFAQTTLHLKPVVSFLASALGSAATVAAAIYGGWLCDRIGRRPLLIWPNLAYLVMVLPLYFWMIAAHSALALLVGTTALGFVRGLAGGAFYATVTEALPKRIRSRVFATIYASAIALFGGTTQLVVTWLIRITGNPMSPAWYLFGALVIGQVAYMLITVRPRVSVPLAAEALP